MSGYFSPYAAAGGYSAAVAAQLAAAQSSSQVRFLTNILTPCLINIPGIFLPDFKIPSSPFCTVEVIH